LKVIELTALHVRIPLRKPIKHASFTRSSTDNVVVRCVLADGTTGYGEGVPREYVTGESIDSVIALLRQSDLGSRLEPCADFPAAVALAERLQLNPVPGDERGCQGNAARCAVELAMLDAYGRRFQEPLAAVTRIAAPDLYQPRTQVQYSGAITSARGGIKLRLAAWRMRLYGFHQVKVKVGIEGYDDVHRLRFIRSRCGAKMDLRIDANEAWQPGEVVERLQALAVCRLSAVEQPVPHAAIGALAEVRKQINVPIMFDESLCGMFDARQAVERQTCDLFNLRLSKCGGFIPTLRLAQYARQHGLGCQLGCQVGETAILSAAGRHFATTVADLRYLEGSYDRHLVQEALATQDITFTWGGKAKALPGPGLGVTLDPAALERVTVRKEALLG